ncbi:MAG: hypothetical protein NZ893_02070 [Candidatus Aenigmarchaeota archaeon]|nr:hypothetical protein [Candidatus Aenigmarchaeota archaeon]
MINIAILREYDNKLLQRKDLLLEIEHSGQPTPKKSDVEKIIADKFKVIPEQVEVIYIFSYVGKPFSKVKAKIWNKPIKKGEVKNEAQVNKEMGDTEG